jgi:AcrR family transcriptional regulator
LDTDNTMALTKDERTEDDEVGASGRKLRAQGHRTRELIVQEAKKLLLEGGSLEFTLRTVARRAHISISNLQYYFPTRAALMRAIMESVVGQYRVEFETPPADAKTARQAVSRLVDQTLADVRSPENSAIWLHFASLAVSDPESARLLDESYTELTRGTGRLLRIINPALDTKESQLLARLISALVDGLVFQIGAGHRPKSLGPSVDARVHEIVDFLIDKSTR